MEAARSTLVSWRRVVRTSSAVATTRESRAPATVTAVSRLRRLGTRRSIPRFKRSEAPRSGERGDRNPEIRTTGADRFFTMSIRTAAYSAKSGIYYRITAMRPASLPEPADGKTDIPPGRKTVLVVDDEDDFRSMVRDLLGIHGFNVIEARDGIEALALLRNFK